MKMNVYVSQLLLVWFRNVCVSFWQQVKLTERYIRRLEFHLSKVRPPGPCRLTVTLRHRQINWIILFLTPHLHWSFLWSLFIQIEELYEAYCLQRRLRDGANKMVKAYIASPVSKEARESLAEANKGYREYTEVRQEQRWITFGYLLCFSWKIKVVFSKSSSSVHLSVNDFTKMHLLLFCATPLWNPPTLIHTPPARRLVVGFPVPADHKLNAQK